MIGVRTPSPVSGLPLQVLDYITDISFNVNWTAFDWLPVQAWLDRGKTVHLNFASTTLDSVLQGDLDVFLKALGEKVGTQNVWIYPNPYCNTDFALPASELEPEKFVSAHRHIVGRVNNPNAKFALSFYWKNGRDKSISWSEWYPGSEFVHAFAVNAHDKYKTSKSFVELVRDPLGKLRDIDPSLPVFISGAGTSVPDRRETWIEDTWNALPNFPEISCVFWDMTQSYEFTAALAAWTAACRASVAPPPVTTSPKRTTLIGAVVDDLATKERDWNVKMDSLVVYAKLKTIDYASIDTGGRQLQLVLDVDDSIASINAGKLDEDLKKLADAIAYKGETVWLRPLRECNLETFVHPWCIYPFTESSVDAFKMAWKRIHGIFSEAPVKFQLCFNANNPRGDPTPYKTLYPGAEYVDSVGVSVYNRAGTSQWHAETEPFKTLFEPCYVQLCAFDKPVFIETGSTEGGRAAWFSAAWLDLTFYFTRVTCINFNLSGNWSSEQDEIAWVEGLQQLRDATR